MMTIIPLFDNILLKSVEDSKLSESGLILPDTIDVKTELCEVVSVGSDISSVKKGDLVIVKKYNVDQLEIEGDELEFAREEDLLAICRKE